MNKKLRIFTCVLLTFLNLSSVGALTLYKNKLNSDAVYVVNKSTGTPIVEKNINKKRSPASITKIMTFIIVYEKCKDLNQKVKITQNVLDLVDPESSGCEFKDGDEFKIIDLLHAMLICSSGAAAIILANYLSGNIENFVNVMNEKAKSLGCTDTHFVNPDGLYNENQYMTAMDVYKMAKYAMEIPLLLNIVAKSEYSFFGDDRDPIITSNKMIDPKRGGEHYYPYVKGIKTGYLEEAGRCLVSYAEKGNSTYISVVMGGPILDENGNKIEKNMAMIDTKNIYIWAFENLKTIKLYPRDFPIAEVNLGLVWKQDKLLLSPKSDFYAALPLNAKKEDVTIKVYAPELVNAPINKGDIIGTANIFYQGQRFGDFDLVSTETFGKNYALIVLNALKKAISSPIFIIIFSLFTVCAIFYIFMIMRENKRRRKRAKVKKFPNLKT